MRIYVFSLLFLGSFAQADVLVPCAQEINEVLTTLKMDDLNSDKYVYRSKCDKEAGCPVMPDSRREGPIIQGRELLFARKLFANPRYFDKRYCKVFEKNPAICSFERTIISDYNKSVQTLSSQRLVNKKLTACYKRLEALGPDVGLCNLESWLMSTGNIDKKCLNDFDVFTADMNQMTRDEALNGFKSTLYSKTLRVNNGSIGLNELVERIKKVKSQTKPGDKVWRMPYDKFVQVEKIVLDCQKDIQNGAEIFNFPEAEANLTGELKEGLVLASDMKEDLNKADAYLDQMECVINGPLGKCSNDAIKKLDDKNKKFYVENDGEKMKVRSQNKFFDGLLIDKKTCDFERGDLKWNGSLRTFLIKENCRSKTLNEPDCKEVRGFLDTKVEKVSEKSIETSGAR